MTSPASPQPGKRPWRAPRDGGYHPAGNIPEPTTPPRGSAGTSQPGSRDEREAEVVRQWMRPGSVVPKGRCPATEQCWYTLPLLDGLVVQHSQAGTLSTCEGGGRPPLATPEPAPSAGPAEDMTVREPSAGQDTERLRDEIAETLRRTHGSASLGNYWHDHADALLDGPLRQLIADQAARQIQFETMQRDIDVNRAGASRAIAERDEARAQVQRVREVLDKWREEAKRADDAEPVSTDGLHRMILAARFLRMSADDLACALDDPEHTAGT